MDGQHQNPVDEIEEEERDEERPVGVTSDSVSVWISRINHFKMEDRVSGASYRSIIFRLTKIQVEGACPVSLLELLDESSSTWTWTVFW